MSEIAAVAQAVVDAINAAGSDLSQSVTAERLWVPAFVLDELDDIGVKVVPRIYDRTNADRRSVAREIPIDVGIAVRLPEGVDPTKESANVVIDPIMQLVEEIADLFQPGELASTGAKWVRTEIPDQPYDVGKLANNRQFLSIVRVTFRIP